MTYRTLEEAREIGLPSGATLKATFGYPGDGGYVEYWRDSTGQRFSISNNPWSGFAPHDWSVTGPVKG